MALLRLLFRAYATPTITRTTATSTAITIPTTDPAASPPEEACAVEEA